ncbi:ABC transporter ATP-binding protein [Enterovirga sp.]|jgi:branched-chain amino acid transport system ATP-binding protein|uniref:ABC transporter ATP-binding protein n=1 Tax=Enterovirga sp. TaxID=2026350 RepID=UPI0026045AFF|nr:ABC transporter ATP-binding protein [Enterovirga sp.]MDB5592978.1 transporter ATP-binding protein [Enterovirga sp.]
MTALLELANLRVGYGQSVVLQDVSLELHQGEIVCLLGANGAGKTTTTRAVSGLLAPWSGEIRFAGENIASIPAHKRVELGICLSPEGRQVFPNFSVHENLLLGSYSKKARQRRAEMFDEVYGLFPRLAERRTQKAGLMSGGEQQMLAIGRALMGCPRLLMLDEPSLGLAPKIILDVYEAVATIAKRGLSILFVEQNVQAALLVAHRGYVLANGQIAAAGTSAELQNSTLVQEAFLGKKPSLLATDGARGHSAAVPAI